MSLLDCPNEVLFMIAQELVSSQRYLNALLQTCQYLFQLFNPILYQCKIDHHEASALTWAAVQGIETTTRNILESGVDPNYQNKAGHTPLSLAAEGGHCKVVHFLLENEAWGDFTLFHAVSRGHEEVFEMILHHLGNSHQPEAKGQLNIALGIAARDGRHQMIRKVLDQGAEITQPTRDNTLARAARRRRLDTINVLLENGADPNFTSPDGDSAFSSAAESGDIPLRQFFLDIGIDMNRCGGAALWSAVFFSDQNMVQFFID